jgi:protein phosphatase 1L
MNIPYGVAETIGRRSTMEDAHAVRNNEERGVFSAEVYDGHSGSLAAVIAAEALTALFLGGEQSADHEKPPARLTPEALREAYLATDRLIVDRGIESGTAAAGLYLTGEGFLVANVGDCRIVVGEGAGVTRLTTDHKPDLPEEQARIEALGGMVITLDVARVQGSLSMSRALGDPVLKPFVTPEPRVAEGTFGRQNDVAVIACDGLWDALTSEEAIGVVRNSPGMKEAAERLLALATAKGSTDNITVIVLDLREYTASCAEEQMHILRVLDRAAEGSSDPVT